MLYTVLVHLVRLYTTASPATTPIVPDGGILLTIAQYNPGGWGRLKNIMYGLQTLAQGGVGGSSHGRIITATDRQASTREGGEGRRGKREDSILKTEEE